MKLAIIGSGISGLAVAHYLHRQHDITLFEANDYPGGHTHTVDVEVGGESHSIDTGFIVFNERTYPRFINLLAELGVESKPTEMSFSVVDERNGLEYNGGSLNGLFAQRRNLWRPGFYQMLADILRFNRQARTMTDESLECVTVGEFLKKYKYSRQFSQQYLLPMGAAIWSCPMGTFADFPLRFVTDFYRNHGLIDLWNRPTWRVISGGSRVYVDRLLKGFSGKISLSTSITGVHRNLDRVELRPQHGPAETFDHVVFACHSDQALRILGEGATPAELTVLSAFPYQRNLAVLHTDTSVLPDRHRAWASWNYRIRRGDSNESPVDVTYNMNILQGIKSSHTFCVTLNPRSKLDSHRVLGEFVYHHPVFSRGRAEAQQRHPEFCFNNRTSFCGAYWRNGFHEDGLVSALAVVDAIGRSSPDRDRQICNERPFSSIDSGRESIS